MSQPERHTDLSVLVKAASEGDSEAWNVITDRFTNLLWSVARSYRLGHDDAADAVQNTWLRLLENLTKIDNPEALPGWLATTARREALGVLRRRGRDVLTRGDDIGVDAVDVEASELDSALLEDERDAQLWACFSQLSERCQQALARADGRRPAGVRGGGGGVRHADRLDRTDADAMSGAAATIGGGVRIQLRRTVGPAQRGTQLMSDRTRGSSAWTTPTSSFLSGSARSRPSSTRSPTTSAR